MTIHIKPKMMSVEDWERLCIEASLHLAKTARCFEDHCIVQRVNGGVCDLVRIGFWIWAEADHFDDFDKCPSIKGYLKGLGFKPSKNRNAYAWSAQPHRGKRSRAGLDSLASKYGYEIGR